MWCNIYLKHPQRVILKPDGGETMCIRVCRRGTRVCNSCKEDILPNQAYRHSGELDYHHKPDCAHAQAQRSEWPQDMTDVPLEEKKSGQRLIRSFEAIARVPHECYHCERGTWHQRCLTTIYPGECYYGEVYVSERGWEVRTYHWMCPEDFPEDWEREFDEEPEEEEELEEKWSLPLAA